MARAVSPWTWRIALRDHGPRPPGVLLTLYVIGSYMGRAGIAYPSQALIAAGIRGSVKTVQRHIAAAVSAGWLATEYAGRGGKGWRHHAYRATVPDGIPLSTVDETLADAVLGEAAGIDAPERGDIAASPRSSLAGDTILSPAPSEPLHETFHATPEKLHRGDIGGSNVATFGAYGGDTGVLKVATQLCRTNSYSETPALRTHTYTEGRIETPDTAEDRRTPPDMTGLDAQHELLEQKEPEDRKQPAEVLQREASHRQERPGTRQPTLSDEQLQYRVEKLRTFVDGDSEILRQLNSVASEDRIRRALERQVVGA